MKKSIGILGSGMVGQALAVGFKNLGHTVMLGTEHHSKLADFEMAHPEIRIGDFVSTAVFGDILVWCIKGSEAEHALQNMPHETFANKTIIDTTNPIADGEPENGVLHFFTNLNESLLERLQKIVPESHFVKAFNSVGASHMVNPDFGGIKPTMFICGNDDTAKNEVSEILTSLGWEVEDMGTAQAARAIEPLCMLWCIPGFRNNEWNHAFKLLKK
jgi:predicted dinucleotide-binding enzyme